MAKHPFRSRRLRELAEQLLDDIADDETLSDADRQDLVTSLVRQWITYDGNAALFVGDRHVFLSLVMTPLGSFRVAVEPGAFGWLNHIVRDWKLNSDELPDIIQQLNRGQSVEVIDSDGVPLRLWVNPKEKRTEVERQVEETNRVPLKGDYRKIAADDLEQLFGAELEPEAIDQLAASLAKQWQTYGGHACLFVNDQRFSFAFAEKAGGFCEVLMTQTSVNVDALLASLGVPADMTVAVTFRINLGHRVEFRDRNGVARILWHDPATSRFNCRPLTTDPRATPSSVRPIFCPKCGAVLKPYAEGDPQQTCPACGHVVFTN